MSGTLSIEPQQEMAGPSSRPWPRRVLDEAWVLVATGTSIVIVVAVVRGLVRGFEPVGDNALTELRAWDVFTSNRPLLGTWSSASVSSGTNLNHPGPMLFDLLAIPVRLLGGRVGVALGGALINLGSVWIAGLAARRLGGRTTALATVTACAVLAWTLGSEGLYDVWQPNVVVLPFLAFLVAVWAVFTGRSWWLVAAVCIGSLCVQAHLSYLFLGPGLLLAAAVALVIRDRRAWWSRHSRPLVIAIGVGLLLWAQPLWEQFTGPGEGNLSRLAGSSGDDVTRTGPTIAIRELAAVTAVPPWFGRPSYVRAIRQAVHHTPGGGTLVEPLLPSLGASVAALVVLAVILGVAALGMRRLGDRITTAGVAVIAVAGALAVYTAAITPIDVFGLSPHKVRWLWSLGAFIAAVLLDAILRASERVRPWVAAGAAAIALVATLATLPTYRIDSGPIEYPWAYPPVASIREQLGPVEQLGSVYFDLRSRTFAEPYSWPIMAELARRHVPFFVFERVRRPPGR